MRSGNFSRSAAFTAYVTLAVAWACSRTSDPVEHYAPTSVAPIATGGKSAASAGKSAAQAGRDGSGNGGAGNSSDGTDSTDGGGADLGGSTASGSGGGDALGASGAGEEAGSGPGDPPNPEVDDCGDAPISAEPFTRRALRAAAADCAQWHYCHFESAARTLAEALESQAATPSDATREKAHRAYSKAWDAWSVNELFQFGPLSSQSESAGRDSYQGRGFRELIYAWPLSSRCRVEEQIVLRTYAGSMSKVLVTGRGLFALDYLLFYPGSDSACTPSSSAGTQWPLLSEEEIATGKLEYAAALGEDILAQTRALRAAWSPDGGNFAPLFVDATGYPSELEAMKVLSWSLIYVEREVKDWKLGIPAGYTQNAPVSETEAGYSGFGTAAIRQNLRGFRALFQGCGPEGEGLGFDDWLSEAGHDELGQDILRAWKNAQAQADATPPLDRATPQAVEALYQSVKQLTDLLKNDLFGAGSPLGLTLPKGVEGDTD